jgi:hypothetical protein
MSNSLLDGNGNARYLYNHMETFKELMIGGVHKHVLIQRLNDAGVLFNKYAPILFENPSFLPSSEIEKVELVKLKFADLGLNNICSYQNILSRASELRLKLCPMHLGAFLRLDYMDQPEGPYLAIASQEPEGDEEYPTGFYLRKFESAVWLRGYRVKGEAEWPPDHEFIFLK